MITISFYSYKGGVGRSLALTNLAVYLAQFGATVVMVDFDLEAPGLHYKLRPGAPLPVAQRGLAGLLADVSSGVGLDSISWDLAIDVSEHAENLGASDAVLEQERGKLLLIPAGDPLTSDYWRDLGSIDWDYLFTSPERPGVTALERLRAQLSTQHQPDVLLVDSRTGITPGGGVSTTLLPDVVVALLLNTAEHIDGTKLVVSAVAEQDGHGNRPKVVPVLSRYTGASLLRVGGRRQLTSVRRAPVTTRDELVSESDALADVRSALVDGLTHDAATRVDEPLVLHTDLSLQHQERLAFGPYAINAAAGGTKALLEDYLRLFAALVPREMFLRYLTGVRNRVRSILLDRPDDAVSTLESLATLVGDEDVFVDLVKAYVLRRDVRNMVLAAERMFRVHSRIVVHPGITSAMREAFAAGRSPVGPEITPASAAEFYEQYWREAGAEDAVWGAGIVRVLADADLLRRARELADEIVALANDPEALATLIRTVAGGAPPAEGLASQLAIDYFELGERSTEFLSAAALACQYHPTVELASKLLDTPNVGTLPDRATIDLLRVAGRFQAAEQLLLDALAKAEPFDGSADQHVESWQALSSRNPELRSELRRRNPSLLEYLDSRRGELS